MSSAPAQPGPGQQRGAEDNDHRLDEGDQDPARGFPAITVPGAAGVASSASDRRGAR